MLNSISYYIKEGLKGIWRHKAMSLAAVISIVIALFILGGVVLFGLNVNSVIHEVESSVDIIVFLKDDVSEQSIKQINDEIKAMNGIAEVKYYSKADAFEKWKAQFGGEAGYLEGYTADNNPLPRSFEIRLQSPSYADEVVSALNAKDGIDKVQYNSKIADTLSRLVRSVRWMGMIIVFVLLIIAVVIIMNTIRLAVSTRKNEINIMRYIGATSWFIRWPFIIEGAIIGVLGALLSIILLKSMYSFVISRLSNLLNMIKFIPSNYAMNVVMLIIIVTGAAAGIIGSAVSIRRYLKV